MQKQHLIALAAIGSFVLFIGATLFSSQPPVSYTNAPGENNCTFCHSGSLNGGPGSVSLSGPATYTPGMVYTLSVSVDDNTRSRFGFLTTVLNSSNLAVGTLAASGTNTSFQTGTVAGNIRQYVGQQNASSIDSWSFQWTAPSNAAGPVTFYTTGNATNNNSSTGGDNVYSNVLVLQPTTTAVFSASDTSVCDGDMVTFTDASFGVISTYIWDFGPGATPPSASTAGPHNVTYSTTGPKTVQLIVDGTNGADTLVQSIRVNELPTPAFSSLPDTICIAGGVQQLVGSPTGGTFSGSGVSGTTFDPATAGSGLHPITYTYTDSLGCSASAFDTTVVVAPISVSITPSGPTTFCPGDSVTLDAGPGFDAYTWSTGDTTQTITVTAGGTFSVMVTDSAISCMGTASQQVIISQPMVTINNLDSVYCEEAAPIVMAGSPSGGSFSGNGVLGASSVYDPSLPGIGAHQVKYVYTDSVGCVDSASQTVTVVPQQTVSVDGFSDTTQYNICPGDTAFSLTGLPAGGAFSSTSLALSGNTIDPGAVDSTSGTFQVTYTFDDGVGCVDSVTLNFFVLESPVRGITAFPSATFCEGDTIQLSVESTSGTNFMWSTGDSGRAIQVTQGGMYSVTGESFVGQGCFATAGISVTENAAPVPAITFSPANTDLVTGTFSSYQWAFVDTSGNFVANITSGTGQSVSLMDICNDPNNTFNAVVTVTDSNGCEGVSDPINFPCIIQSIESGELQSLEVFPNPAKDVLNLRLELASPIELGLRIVDATGRTVFADKWESANTSVARQIPTQALSAGSYMLLIRTETSVVSRRFVKEK